MIVVTRLNGPPLAINCDLIERAEACPDTVLTLVDGTKFVIQESVEDVIDRIREFRASVVVMSQKLEAEVAAEPTLRVVHGHGLGSDEQDESTNPDHSHREG